MRDANKTYDARVDRDHEPQSVEWRLAKLEERFDTLFIRLIAFAAIIGAVIVLARSGLLKSVLAESDG